MESEKAEDTVTTELSRFSSWLPLEERRLYTLTAGLEQRERVRRLVCTFADGSHCLIAYHHIGDIDMTADGHGMSLSLIGGNVLLCTGDNLHQLIPSLQAETLPHLYCFNPTIHRVSEGSEERIPILYQIERIEKEER